MASNSKFSIRQRRPKPPGVCKAVDDSFRHVPIPMKKEMSWSTEGSLGGTVGTWSVNGAGSLAQIGNPIFQWQGTIGKRSADHAFVRLFFDDIARILTIDLFAIQDVDILLQRQRIIVNVDLDQPLGTDYLLFTNELDDGTIRAQFLF
ncbi:MAG: hypothetical protein IID41_13005 [Planctomycetes bacterium]|nr:hypothetical protein [Planctomycetota bacterium]